MKKILVYISLIIFCCYNNLWSQRIITIEESKHLALQNNSKTKNSILEIEASHKIKESAYTNYFPSVTAGGMIFEAPNSLMEMKTKGGNLPVYDGNPANIHKATQFAYMPGTTMSLLTNGTVGYLNIIQPVYAGGRITNGNKLAALGEDVSAFKDKLTKNEVILKTEEQYWQIVSLEEKLLTVNKYEDFLKSLQNQVVDAFKSGVVMKNDVLKVKLKLSEIQLNKSKLENGIKLAMMSFCQHIGIPFDSTLSLDYKLEITGLPQEYYADKNTAFKLRTEYSLLEKSVEAEKLQTNIKRGEYLPQAGVGLSGMYMQMDESDGRTVGMVFASLSVPLSGWWGGSYELDERNIKEEIAENNMLNNSEMLVLQIEKTWQDFVNAYNEYQLSLESKTQAEENYKVNEDSYKNGLINVSDLLEAQALLQTTHNQLTDAITNYNLKKTNYLQAIGKN